MTWTDGTNSVRSAAHALALRALDLTAHVFATLVTGVRVVERLEDFEPVWQEGRIPLLAPRRFLDEDDQRPDPLPHHWDVTTDAIAARLAVRLEARELVLLKSATLPKGTDRRAAARLGLVDPAFPAVSAPLRRVTYLNLRDPTARPVPLPLEINPAATATG